MKKEKKVASFTKRPEYSPTATELLSILLSGTAKFRRLLTKDFPPETEENKRYSDIAELITKVGGCKIEVLHELVALILNVPKDNIVRMDRTVKPVKGALVRLTKNPNSHNYGSAWFIMLSDNSLSGIKSSGNEGNSFPSPQDVPDAFVAASDDEIYMFVDALISLNLVADVAKRL